MIQIKNLAELSWSDISLQFGLRSYIYKLFIVLPLVDNYLPPLIFDIKNHIAGEYSLLPEESNLTMLSKFNFEKFSMILNVDCFTSMIISVSKNSFI